MSSVTAAAIDPISGQYIATIVRSKSDTDGFFGKAKHMDAADADPVWQIGLTRTDDAGVTTTSYAGNGEFEYQWSARTTYFDPIIPPPEGYTNQNSLLFTGVGTYVTFGDNFAFDKDDPFSISMWIRPRVIGAAALWSRTTNDATLNGFGINLTATNTIQIYTRAIGTGVETQSTTTVLSPNLWYHLVVTFSGNSNMTGFKVYLNGVLDYSGTNDPIAAGSWISTQTARLGARGDSALNYYGYMDEVAVYTSEINLAAVQALYGGGTPTEVTAAQHWYRMGDDGDTATTVFDNIDAVNGSLINFPVQPYAALVPP